MKKVTKIFYLIVMLPLISPAQKMPVSGEEKCVSINDSTQNCEINHIKGGKVAEGIRLNGKANGLWIVYSNKKILQKRYYSHGNLDSLITYNGAKFNSKTYYKYNSDLDTSVVYESYSWFENGNPYNQFKDNHYTEWYINGQKRSAGDGYYMPNLIKNGTWYLYSTDGKVIEKESYKNGIFHGEQLSYDNNGILTKSKVFFKNIPIGSEKNNNPDGTLNTLILHYYSESTNTLIDSTFYGSESKLAIVDSIIFLNKDTLYKVSKSFYPLGNKNPTTKTVIISVKKNGKEIYRRDIRYWNANDIKEDFTFDFLNKNTVPEIDKKIMNNHTYNSLEFVKSLYTYFQNGVLNEKYLFINNDSVHYSYERFDSNTKPMYSIVQSNPSKTNKIIYYSNGFISKYYYTKPDQSYTILEFNDKNIKTYEKIGVIKQLENKITLRMQGYDFYTTKQWDSEMQLCYVKTHDNNKSLTKEYYKNGKLKYQIDSISKISSKAIKNTVITKSWNEKGKPLMKEKYTQNVPLDVSTLKITESITFTDAIYSMFSGNILDLDNKSYIPYCKVTLRDEKNSFFVTSDRNGYFEIKNIPASNYTIVISNVNYCPMILKVKIESKQLIKSIAELKLINIENKLNND